MKFLIGCTIVIAFGYILYLIIEPILINKYRKSFKYVVHVNGIRGKSTTTKLIDSIFRGAGFKTFSKTTGTLPYIIDTSNNDVLVKRLGKANIREQIKMMKKAYKEHAEVLILECMAVNPEYQALCEDKILKADITVITNVRSDHLGDMGNTLEEIANSLSNTTPTNGTLVLGENKYLDIFKKVAIKKNSKVIVAEDVLKNKDIKQSDLDNLETFNENISIAIEVGKLAHILPIDSVTFMQNYHHDFGAYEELRLNKTVLLNGFSINDPESIKMVYDKIIKDYNPNTLTILLNSRVDRSTRLVQHLELIKSLKYKKLIITGSNLNYVKKHFPDAVILQDLKELEQEEVIFGIGNIMGEGLKVIEYFRKGAK